MKKVILSLLSLVIVTLCFAGDKKEWKVSDGDAKVVNPIKSDAKSIAAGKILYTKFCQSCHGVLGKGDGKKAATLDTDPGDFSKAEFQKQSDGSLYYKTVNGREDMPTFGKKVSKEETWKVVNYLRTFKK